MANPTTNFGWVMPTSTSLVTNLPADFNTFGQAVDTSMSELLGGTTGQVLSKTSNTNMDFTWVTPTDQTPLTTKGDLFTFSTVDARLAVGTNGQTLVADSTASTGLKWATPSSGGGLTLLSTTSLTTGTTTISSISGSYKNLVMFVKDFTMAASADLSIFVNSDQTSSNYHNLIVRAFGTTVSTIIDSSFTGAAISGYQALAAGSDTFCVATINDYANTTTKKLINLTAVFTASSGSSKAVNSTTCGYHGTVAAITSVSFLVSGSTWSSGSVEIYGEN